jgi:hypothetical protein
MRGRGTAFRDGPLVVMPQKRSLFLRAGNGQAQVIDGFMLAQYGRGRCFPQ